MVEIMPFIMVIVIVFMVLAARILRGRQETQKLTMALEKGLSPSDIRAILGPQRPAASRARRIGVGCFFLVLALGLFVTSWILCNHGGSLTFDDQPSPPLGFFLMAFGSLAVGVATVVSGLLCHKMEKPANAATTSAQVGE